MNETIYRLAVQTPYGVWDVRVSNYSPREAEEAAVAYVLRQDERVSRNTVRVL